MTVYGFRAMIVSGTHIHVKSSDIITEYACKRKIVSGTYFHVKGREG